jgi:hypothetical protein
VPFAVRYGFSQHFDVASKAAFDWCTDYQPTDHALIGNSGAKRVITKVADGVVLIKDSFSTKSGQVEKEKLVHFYPERLSWTSTHISGLNRHSQFTYQIVAETDGTSRLDFTALHVEYRMNLTEKELAALAEELCAGDAAIWRRFAAAMKKELTGQL